MTAKIMISLPDQLVVRMRAAIPARDRSKLMAQLLEKELTLRENKLYHSALEMEQSTPLKNDMMDWDASFGQDGLSDDAETFKSK